FVGGVKGQLDEQGQPTGRDLPELQRKLLGELWSWTAVGFDEAWLASLAPPKDDDKAGEKPAHKPGENAGGKGSPAREHAFARVSSVEPACAREARASASLRARRCTRHVRLVRSARRATCRLTWSQHDAHGSLTTSLRDARRGSGIPARAPARR